MAWAGEGIRADAKQIIIKCPSCKFVFRAMNDMWVAVCPSCRMMIPGDLKRYQATREEHIKCIRTHPLYREARRQLGFPEPPYSKVL